VFRTYTAKYTKITSGYMGQLVEWPEVITEGKDIEECRYMLKDALEADALIDMKKQSIDNQVWNYPSIGGAAIIPLISLDRKENFFLDITRSRIHLKKGTYQNRGRNIVILVRLDFGGTPHRNPDGEEVPSPHIHIYKEGFGDKWAYPVPDDTFSDTSKLGQTFEDFMKYCNIVRPPIIQKGLW
jgi:hypothetical protein